MKGLRAVLPRAVRKRITFGFGTALLLIALGFGLTLFSYNQYRKASVRIEHSQQVTNRLGRILSLITDVETGERGYLASSGDGIYLTAFEDALPQFSPELDQIRSLVADNPQQIRNLDSLTKRIDTKIAMASQQIDAVKNKLPISIARTYMMLGKARMDRVRELLKKMTEIEQERFDLYSRAAEDSFRNTLIIIFTLSLLTFVTLIVSYNLLENELNTRQKTEDQLRAYEDELQDKIQLLEISNEELERFAFVASHDMQEPLRKIQSFGYLLRDRHEIALTADGIMYLNKILQSAERMSKMIKDLLNFSRISSKKEPFRSVRLADVVQGVLSDQELKINAANGTFHIDRLATIEAVQSQMDHLFSNLISNALKFTKPDQPPVITIQGVSVNGDDYEELVPGKKYYKITIADNGIGFNEKYIDHIFKIFQRLHGKSSYEGTGIGLAICKRIVNNHKGLITAQSQPNVGTTFIIVLPEKQNQSVHDNATTHETSTYTIG
ncbi:sensor histidine kinase [Larkinella rosea]|uniref:histidine kinase n=1 Tax=Larkinella rosea TaxID=2025312 RepID=A0A3P1C254_9BACT|nr:sensor histidine kinase [Larkinella rosea]RRB07348.1 histidine kinase [Larkinella rosea]